MHITIAQRKFISSLSAAKHRREESLFIAEGYRTLSELLSAFEAEWVVVTTHWLENNAETFDKLKRRFNIPEAKILTARNDEFARLSSMTTPQGILAVLKMHHPVDSCEAADKLTASLTGDELMLALDRVQDPGNLGTILRVADWFGISKVLATSDSADVFNPKTVQASMGALARVSVCYCDLAKTLSQLSAQGTRIYGTFLDGDNIYSTELTGGGVIVVGNEGKGISAEIAAIVDRKLLIPSFPPGEDSVESLNVAAATAVTVAEFRRRSL